MDEKDLTWLFSLHPHTPLNSTVFLYSRNMKNNFFNLSLHKIDYMAAKLGSNDI
jgi:hypothetical protein